MIRRLATAIRRLTRRQPTPPSEPHSPHAEGEYCWTCNTWGGPAAANLVGLATALDRLDPGPRTAYPDPWGAWDCGPDPLDPAPTRPAVQHLRDVVERQRPPSLPTGGTR